MSNKIYHTLSVYDRAYILKNYQDKSCGEIATYIGCNTNTVRQFLRKQNLDTCRYHKWTRSRNLELIDLVKKGYSAKSLASKFNVTRVVIYNRLSQLRREGYDVVLFSEIGKERLTDEDKQYIRDNTNKLSIKEMTDWIGCNSKDIRKYQESLNIKTVDFYKWSPERNNTMLKLLLEGKKTKEVAEALNTTVEKVRQQLYILRKQYPSIPTIPIMRLMARRNNTNINDYTLYDTD